MILTEEQAKARVNSEGNLLNRFGKSAPVTPSNVIQITPLKQPGCGGPHHESNPNGVEITSRARLGENQFALAEEFGLTQQAVSHYKHGDYKVDEKKVESRMIEVQDTALCKLMASLGFLDDEKLSKMSGKDLASVAANMAKVAGNVRPSAADGNAVHLHLYAPELRKEANYKTIEVSSL